MKILNILLANTLLASSGSAILKSPKNPKVFALTTNNPNSQLLPFVEVGFTLADYIYFQEEGDFESIVDYIITSKKINIDKILSDPAVSEKLNEVIKQSGLTIQKAKTIMVGIIAQKIASEVHDSYKKDVEEITGGSSSSGGGSGSSSSSSSGKTFTPALTKANWLLSNLGTAAILEWFDAEYGAKGSDSKGTGGEAKWEATVDYTTKAHTYAKADDGRLQTLFGTWKAKGGSNYNAKKDAFIGPQPSDVDKKIIWQNNNNANYLSAYNTWRASATAGKGQDVLKPIWKATTSGAYNYQDAQNQWKSASGQLSDWKADTTTTGGDAKLTAFMADVTKKSEILTFWKTDATDDGFDKKVTAWLADVNAGAAPKTKKAWYWSNSFRTGVDSWIQGLTSGSAGVSDESLVKSAWYFSPDYVAEALGNLRPALGNAGGSTAEQRLDNWLATAEGIDAARHFAANNPSHSHNTTAFNFWKTQSNSNYNSTSNKWLDRVNKIGDTNNYRSKPSKSNWLTEGHDAWDSYKAWSDGAAREDTAAINAVKAKITTPDGAKSSDYKTSPDSDRDFNIWFNNLPAATKDTYYTTAFKASPAFATAKSNFPSTQMKNESWGTNNFALRNKVARKMSASMSLFNKFKAYRNRVFTNSAARKASQVNIEALRDNDTTAGTDSSTNLFKLAYEDAEKNQNTNRITAAKTFKTAFIEENVRYHSHILSHYKWKREWYDLDKASLSWNNWHSRYYWVAANNIRTGQLMTYVLTPGVYGNYTLAQRQALFESRPMGISWKYNNPGATNAVIQQRANLGFVNLEEWVLQVALNDLSKGSAPAAFTTWKNNFKPYFQSDKAYRNYIDSLTTIDKKDFAWTDYAASAGFTAKYEAWKIAQDAYKDEVSKELKKDYDTHKTQYNNSATSNSDYSAWSPWYIKTSNDYDMYVKNALTLEETTPITQQLYFRYMAARNKENNLFHVGNSYTRFDNWLWGLGNKAIGIAKTNEMFRHSKFKLDSTLAEQTDVVENNVDKPEYRGGYTERKAYASDKTDYKDVTNKNTISEDIMENHKDIFLDIATRYPAYQLDELGGSYTAYALSKGLWSKKWLSEFSDSNREAYYAYRDKFLDNSNTGRAKVTPFSDADITSMARQASLLAKQQLYVLAGYMNSANAAKISSRKNDFLDWAKDTDKRYNPILMNHYQNSDSLSGASYEAWEPYWLHSKADYEKIFGLSSDDIDVPLVGGETKLTKKAQTQHIALIKYFTKEMAQREMASGATISDKTNTAQGAGQKFWNTIWQEKKSNKIYEPQILSKADFKLWNSLYKTQSQFTSANGKLNAFYEITENIWKEELGAFDLLAYIIKKMEDGNDIDWNSDFIDKDDIKLSQEIIDYDKTKPKAPQSDITDFKTNRKDDIWTKVFLAKEANYKTDYEAWLSGKYDTTAAYDAAFEKWSKVLTNGQVEFLAHGDATSAMRNWVIPTLKIQAEYDIINPTWDNLKLLWAKETFLSWKLNVGHFYNWFNNKLDFNGIVSDDFLSAYRLEPIGVARTALDEDGTYSKAEESAHIINDFNNRAWWLIKYYIDQTASAPSEFTTWLNLYNIPAKRDLITEIDAGNLEAEAKVAYKASDEHLNGYKSWRNAISSSAQRVEYNGLAVSNTKYDDYKANYDGWS